MTNEDFNDLIGIKESYEMPERLMEILTGENVIDFYEKLLNLDLDLSKDVLREYFQAEHGDRGKLKQDYTPDCVCELVRRLSGDDEDTLDICAGTGALTIACGRSGEHRCEEVSERAMIPTGRFTRPELTEETHTRKWKRIVSNPPYSLKFPDVDKSADDPRFSYGLTPSGFSDYLFIQDAISRLDEDGTLVEILPHGVLFRGKREETIRKKLIDANLIDAIIGLPDNLFMNTGIPVLLMILKKGRNRDDILMVDASKECVKEGKVNIMTPEQINRVCSAVNIRRDIDKLSHVTTLEEIRENGYNLNIPRYVDTFEPEPVPDLLDTLAELKAINMEIDKTERELIAMAAQLVGTTPEAQEIVDKANELYREYLDEKNQRNDAAAGGDDRESKKREALPRKRDADRIIGNKRSGQISFF